ncbi:hypothetical protein GCM10011581_14520 [Saccharopolyspora subtropica]|uniref:Uncharacterized protein n=1 Tax=Saccharopolyspora thermophila TaxID=89367 RepID=A0A917JN68_9PSEU|nr:hypothetical protein [Saccharopolyspora subtropica]GGI78488.1 hypothetical protein GCM10011581_14520 [Saccharopolyspora subtropica]
MENPSTSRRHDHNGRSPVTVAELIRREPLTPEHERLVTELLAAPEPTDGTPALGSRLAFGALGVVLMVGAAIAGAMILADPASAPRPVTTTAPISGVLALRPDLVRDATWPFTDNGGVAAASGTGAVDEEPAAAVRSTANPTAGSEKSAINVVTEFYRRLEQDPPSATALVSPQLLAGQRAELLGAWTEVNSVQQSVRVDSDGRVLAEIEAGYPDGHRVVLRQRLTVEHGIEPEIVGAELVSARHQAPR